MQEIIFVAIVLPYLSGNDSQILPKCSKATTAALWTSVNLLKAPPRPWRNQKNVDVSPVAKCTFNAVLHQMTPPPFHQMAHRLPSSGGPASIHLTFMHGAAKASISTRNSLGPAEKSGIFPKRIDLMGVRAAQSHYLSLLASSCSQGRNRKQSPRPTASAILNPFSHVSRSFFQDFLKVKSLCFSF